MAPLRRTLTHEVRALFADRIVWIAAVAVILLSGYAVHVGARAAEAHRAQVEAALAEEAERYALLRTTMEEVRTGNASLSPFQDPTRPYVAGRGRGQRYAVLPTSPFQASAVGQSDLIPPVVPVILDGADPRSTREEIENPVHLLSGPLDLAFVVTFLLPLLALALSFDLLSREREQGTLALLLSQPISARRLTLAKLLARWGLLVVLAVGAAGLGFLVVGGGLALDRFLLWGGIVALYLAFWVGLAAVVNVTGRDSARNAVALAFLWLVFVILIPAGVQITAGLVHPVPSRAELVALEREEVRQVQEQAAAVLAQYYDDHPELLPEGSVDEVDFQTRAFAVNEEVRARLAPVRARYREGLEAQREWIHTFRWLSPTILTYEALVELAGTGDGRVDRFEREVEAFHARWVAHFEPLIYGDRRLSPEDLDRLPAWEFREEGGGELRAALLPGMLGLLLFAGIALAAALGLLKDGGDRRWTP
jgi:ABC-2 type transport system permease protein